MSHIYIVWGFIKTVSTRFGCSYSTFRSTAMKSPSDDVTPELAISVQTPHTNFYKESMIFLLFVLFFFFVDYKFCE